MDIVHADQKLYLVFEFLDVDLKRYMENLNQARTPITLPIVKVRPSSMLSDFIRLVPGSPDRCPRFTRLSTRLTRLGISQRSEFRLCIRWCAWGRLITPRRK